MSKPRRGFNAYKPAWERARIWIRSRTLRDRISFQHVQGAFRDVSGHSIDAHRPVYRGVCGRTAVGLSARDPGSYSLPSRRRQDRWKKPALASCKTLARSAESP